MGTKCVYSIVFQIYRLKFVQDQWEKSGYFFVAPKVFCMHWFKVLGEKKPQNMWWHMRRKPHRNISQLNGTSAQLITYVLYSLLSLSLTALNQTFKITLDANWCIFSNGCNLMNYASVLMESVGKFSIKINIFSRSVIKIEMYFHFESRLFISASIHISIFPIKLIEINK